MATAPYPFPYPSAATYPPPLLPGAYRSPFPYTPSIRHCDQIHHHEFPSAPDLLRVQAATPTPLHAPSPPLYYSFPTPCYSTSPAVFTFPYPQVHAPPPESTTLPCVGALTNATTLATAHTAAYSYPPPASAYTPATAPKFSPSAPLIPPTHHTSFDCSNPSRSHLSSSSDYPLKPLPVSASSEFCGTPSVRSPLYSRPRLQQLKDGGGKTKEDDGATLGHDCTFQVEKSSNALHPSTPNFRCQGSDFIKGSATPRNDCVSQTEKSGSDDLSKGKGAIVGASLDGEQLVHKHTGPAIHSMVDASLNNRFFKKDDASVQAVADEHIPAKDCIRHRLQRELLNLQARLDQQQARDRTSFDTIQGELAKLTSMASQLASSIDKHSTLAASGSSPVEVAGTASVTPKVFGEMPRPNSWLGAHAIAPEYENYGCGYPNQIQNSCAQPGSTDLSEQYLDGLPHHYGFRNLKRQTVFLADGTEHSYYALPESYPVEQATAEPVFDVYDDETEDCSNALVDVSEQQSYEEERQEEVQDITPERQQQDEERACTCPVRKASDSLVTRSSQLIIVHSVRDLRLLWDPGASPFLVTPLNNDNKNDTIGVFHEVVLAIPPAKPPERYHSADSSPVDVQLRSPPLNVLVIHEKRNEWDPGDTKIHVLFTVAAVAATKLQRPDIYKLAIVQKLVMKFDARRVPIFQTEIMRFYASDLGWLTVLLQWDPGIAISSYMYIWLEMRAVKTLTWLQIPLFNDLQSQLQMSKPFSVWDPGILNLMDMMLGTIAVPNTVHFGQTPCKIIIFSWQPVDLKQLWAELSQYHSWDNTPNVCLQVQYYCLQMVLACQYSVTVCYSRKFSSIEAIHSALSMSTASTMRMGLVLSFGKIAQEGGGAAAVYHVSNIQLPMSKPSYIWDPGIDSLMCVYIWLHIHMIQQVDCSATKISTQACSPPTQISTQASSNTELDELTSPCVGFHLQQSTEWTSTSLDAIASSEYAYTMDFIIDQWEFLHKQGVQKNYNAKNLLSSSNYLQILELDIIFITFLPP